MKKSVVAVVLVLVVVFAVSAYYYKNYHKTQAPVSQNNQTSQNTTPKVLSLQGTVQFISKDYLVMYMDGTPTQVNFTLNTTVKKQVATKTGVTDANATISDVKKGSVIVVYTKADQASNTVTANTIEIIK